MITFKMTETKGQVVSSTTAADGSIEVLVPADAKVADVAAVADKVISSNDGEIMLLPVANLALIATIVSSIKRHGRERDYVRVN